MMKASRASPSPGQIRLPTENGMRSSLRSTLAPPAPRNRSGRKTSPSSQASPESRAWGGVESLTQLD